MSLERDFIAPRWLRSPHLQTLGAAAPLFAPPRSHARAHAEALRVPLPSPPSSKDGFEGRLHAQVWWAAGTDARPAIVIVHGIGGSSESRYVVRAAVALHREGYHVVRLDLRGAGQSIDDAPSLYHAGLTSDLAHVAAHVARLPRVSGVVFLGFSGGGTMALKLAGEWGAEPPPHVKGVVSISAPLDYTKVAPWMDSVSRFPYRFHVLRGLTNGAREFARRHASRAHYAPRDVKRYGSFRRYDSTIIVPMHGFTDVDAYYSAASAGPWLPRIALPTLLVHAEDDPMVPGKTVRPWLAEASRDVSVAISPHGGHIGWVSGWGESSWVASWAVKRAIGFVRERAPVGSARG